MKIKGQKLDSSPNREFIVIPRGDDREDIVLWAEAVLDMSGFEKLCPAPLPPAKIVKGGRTEYNVEAPNYLSQLNTWSDKRVAYWVIKSLDVPENEMEWETVDIQNHKTWLKWREELTTSGFSTTEINRIENMVYSANCLNEAKLEAARSNFLRGRALALESISGHLIAPVSTSTTTPASGGESAPQG